MKHTTVALVLFAGIMGNAHAQIIKKSNGYLFRMKFTKGAIVHYQADSVAGGLGANGQGIKFGLPIVWKVLDVKSGIATVEATIGPVLLGEQQVMKASVTKVQLNSQGKPVAPSTGAQQLTPVLPAVPIKPGATWTASLPMTSPAGGMKKTINATYKFTGIKSVEGKQVAVINVSTTGESKGSGVIYLLVSDGSLYQSTLNMDVTVSPQAGTTSTYKITAKVKRVKG